MNRIYQGKVTNVETANPDQHAPRILSASTAVPRPRERERVVGDRVRVVGEEPISAERTEVRCRNPFNQPSTLNHQLPQQHHQLFQDAVNSEWT
jgi:hypothetical protein